MNVNKLFQKEKSVGLGGGKEHSWCEHCSLGKKSSIPSSTTDIKKEEQKALQRLE